MRKPGKFLARAAVAASLSGVVALGGFASVATAQSAAKFEGSSTGYALRVTLDVQPVIAAVPELQAALDTVWQAVPGQSGSFPGVIDQYFIKTSSDADASGVTKARSALAEGLLNLDSVEATQMGQTVEHSVQALQIPSADLPILQATVGTLKAAITQGPISDGDGALKQVDVGLALESLGADANLLDSLLEQLQGAVDEVVGELETVLGASLAAASDDLVSELGGTITGLAGGLPLGDATGLASGLGIPAEDLSDADAVEAALTDLLDPDALLAQVTDLLESSLLDGSLATVTGLVNTANVTRQEAGKTVADAASSLENVSVLGGLVDIGAFNLSSHSEAAGTPGTAANTSTCSIVDVRIGGDELAFSLDGTNVFINGTAVPVVGDLVATVKGLADDVLGAVGIDIGLCDAANGEAAADGSKASQSVSALHVEVAPAGLFNLVIDPTVQTSVSAVPAVAAAPVAPVTLPRTGAPALLTALMGLGLTASAVMLRRRVLKP